jgi:hypothetical protein
LSVLLRSNLLLSLSDGIVSVHDIGVQTNPNNGSRTPVISIRTQLKAKQAVLFALDTSTPECRLCVATAKKRLCFYRLAIGSKVLLFFGSFCSVVSHDELCVQEFEDLGERPTPDVARSLVWAASKICVGYKKEYVLLDFKTGASQELFETGKLGAPIGAVINQQILLNKDNISIFYGFDGKPSRKYGIAWNEPPVDFGYAFPYVIGLLPSGVELSEEQKNCMLSELNKQKKKEL